jgi:hypothetical protein
MSSRYGDNTDARWLLQGSPSGVRNQSMEQIECGADLAALTTQVMSAVAVPCQVGDLISNITFVSGATPAGTPTNWWFALYSADATPVLLGQSADQLTTAWGASTVKTLALATAVRIPSTGVYYAAVMVKATTVPTLAGRTVNLAVSAGSILSSKVLSQTSGAALVATAPATIATPTTVATVPFCVLN